MHSDDSKQTIFEINFTLTKLAIDTTDDFFSEPSPTYFSQPLFVLITSPTSIELSTFSSLHTSTLPQFSMFPVMSPILAAPWLMTNLSMISMVLYTTNNKSTTLAINSPSINQPIPPRLQNHPHHPRPHSRATRPHETKVTR